MDSDESPIARTALHCQEWDEFSGVNRDWAVLGGLGNFGEIVLLHPAGEIVGCTLRVFNPSQREWSLYWSASLSGVLLPPMVGRFNDQGVGEFYAQEVQAGRTVYSRFIWNDITPDSAHWEQALSADGGQTWETNWTMDFQRLSVD